MKDDAHNVTTNWPVSINNEATQDFAIFLAPLLPPLPELPWRVGGYLLEYDKDDEDVKEDEDFNRERVNYAYLYEGEIL